MSFACNEHRSPFFPAEFSVLGHPLDAGGDVSWYPNVTTTFIILLMYNVPVYLYYTRLSVPSAKCRILVVFSLHRVALCSPRSALIRLCDQLSVIWKKPKSPLAHPPARPPAPTSCSELVIHYYLVSKVADEPPPQKKHVC